MRYGYLIAAGILLALLLVPAGRRFLRRVIPDYQAHGSLHYLLGLEYWQHNAHVIRFHVWFGMLVWSIPFRRQFYRTGPGDTP